MEYLEYNGGIPKLAQRREHEDDDVWIKAFLPMRERISYGKSMAETYTTGLREKYLPQGLVPFAVDHGGNYLCFNHRGEVFFCGIDAWDPDKTEQQNQVEVVTPLCLSFRAFVQGLRRGESLD